MIKWHNAANEKPAQGENVLLLLVGGIIHEGRWLKNANKYVMGVNRWYIYPLKKYVDESHVIGWLRLEEVKEHVGVRTES